MQRPAKPGKLCRASKLQTLLAWGLLGLGCTLAGCSTHHQLASKEGPGDPLLGPSQPPAQTTSPLHATTPPGGGLGPIPSNAGLSTNAALASQTATPQSLAISQGDGWARKVDGTAVKTPGQPVSQPRVEPIPKDSNVGTGAPVQPIKQTNWSASSQPATPTTPTTPTTSTTEQLDEQLKAHGVLAHEQAPEGTGIRLTVVVANPTNPDARDNFYTIAPDYATAVAAIIREIDAKRAHP
jgi:hypothetical protein